MDPIHGGPHLGSRSMVTALPPPADGPAAWMGVEMALRPERWTGAWSETELGDVIEVARSVDIERLIDPDADRLVPASLLTLAAELRCDLQDRHGFVLLEGLPVSRLDRRTVAAVFMLLGLAMGRPRSQNAAGHLLGHVRDVGADPSDASTRIYQTHERQTFHTDSCDAVGLLCLQTAASGGRSMLASAQTAYRIMHERRPDLAVRLFDTVATDRRGEQPDGQKPWFEIPVLSWFDDNLTVVYQRAYIDSAARFPDAPVLDPQHAEALDLLDAVVNEPDVHLSMELEPGDIQFVYNHSLLHDRTAFVDHPEPTRRRHLLRLWLSLPDDRRLPPVFAQRYGSVAVGDRGGIVTADTELCIPID